MMANQLNFLEEVAQLHEFCAKVASRIVAEQVASRTSPDEARRQSAFCISLHLAHATSQLYPLLTALAARDWWSAQLQAEMLREIYSSNGTEEMSDTHEVLRAHGRSLAWTETLRAIRRLAHCLAGHQHDTSPRHANRVLCGLKLGASAVPLPPLLTPSSESNIT